MGGQSIGGLIFLKYVSFVVALSARWAVGKVQVQMGTDWLSVVSEFPDYLALFYDIAQFQHELFYNVFPSVSFSTFSCTSGMTSGRRLAELPWLQFMWRLVAMPKTLSCSGDFSTSFASMCSRHCLQHILATKTNETFQTKYNISVTS
jgi:hypothetical protein